MQMAVSLGRAEKVWSEQLDTDTGDMVFSLPEGGIYQVVFVRVESNPKIGVAKRPSAVDLIGYGRKFNSNYRPTAEIMQELREGEEA